MAWWIVGDWCSAVAQAMADGVRQAAPEDLSSISEWLESQGLLKHFPLFVGYADTGPLLRFTEADFVRLGVTNANDRRTMLRSLAEEASLAKVSLDEGSGASAISGRVSPLVTARKGSTAGVAVKKLFGKGKSPVKAMPLQSTSGSSSQSTTASASSMTSPVSLEYQPWFHGLITRKQAEAAVKKDGDILVRESISKKGSYALTTRWKSQALHFVINRLETVLGGGTPASPPSSQSKQKSRKAATKASTTDILELPELAPPVVMYRFERDSFPSIVELINHYLHTKQPISEVSGAIAKYPVPRVASSETQQSKSMTPNNSFTRLSTAMKDTQSMGSSDDLLASRSASGTDLSQMVFGSLPSSAMPSTSMESGISGFLGNGLGSPPSVGNYEVVHPNRFQDGDSIDGLSTFSSSSSLQPAGGVDAPDSELLKAMCSVIFTHPVAEISTHLTRVNMRLAHFVLPDEDLQTIDKFLPVDLSEREIQSLREAQESWRRGKVGGLASVHLEQGRPLAELLLQRVNSISYWVAAAVIGAGDLAKRRNMLCRMIEIAQHLQSDALADLFGFMAIMRGLQMSCVTRLRTTWANLRRHASSVAVIYESQLCQLADSLRQGSPTHEHLIPSLPYLEPILLLSTKEMNALHGEDMNVPVDAWEVGLDVYGLDAVRNHLHAARALCVQCGAYRLAGTARLRGMKVLPELEAYFRRDFPSLLFMSRPGMHSLDQPTAQSEIKCMLQVMSEAAESESL